MTMLRTIETFLKRSGIAATQFGRDVARDPRLVHDMRLGRQLGPRLRMKVQAYIAEHQA
jgi:2,4-dienoyl-CoA reductase-like NADH-dependent reductase (Old Yellow Enzyme family)